MACLRSAVRPKTELNRRHPGVAPWIVFGVPRTVLVDNAWEFTGASFRDACDHAGISIEWAPVKTPEYKGIVERVFGTLNKGLLHKLAGGVPMKPHKLAELGINPQAEAVLLLSEIDELLHQYFVENYGRSVHRGINAIPEQVWRKGAEADGVEYAQNLKALDHALGKKGPDRVLSSKGLEFKGLTYSSAGLYDLLNRLLPISGKRGRPKNTAPVKFKYWPEDISKVAVWDPVTTSYVELRCTHGRYASGISEHHHDVLLKFARENNHAFSSEAARALPSVAQGASLGTNYLR